MKPLRLAGRPAAQDKLPHARQAELPSRRALCDAGGSRQPLNLRFRRFLTTNGQGEPGIPFAALDWKITTRRALRATNVLYLFLQFRNASPSHPDRQRISERNRCG
jgi:hypothetical protein